MPANSKTTKSKSYKVDLILLIIFLIITVPVIIYLYNSTLFSWLNPIKAVSSISNFEAESATRTGNVEVKADTTASSGSYIELGTNLATGNTFQPTAPYYSAFYYAWYKAPTVTNQSYSNWSDGHNPPKNWFSNYLPIPPGAYDSNSKTINPSIGLYSSRDQNNFNWQAKEMLNAKIEVAISSWWGQSASTTGIEAGPNAIEGKSDYAFRLILKNFMKSTENPYPNLRWTIYYEKEGFANPSIDEIKADLEYIASQYADDESFLKINNRPVLFVYGSDSDSTNGCAMSARWVEARNQVAQSTGKNFYLGLKLFDGFAGCASQPDTWHQYAPAAAHYSAHQPYSAFVSPGFWKDPDGVRLARDTSASLPLFRDAVTKLVASNVNWKLVQTWNEWNEGTSVEPGVQVVQKTGTGVATYNPSGAPFEHRYIDVLSELFPALEAGSGR